MKYNQFEWPVIYTKASCRVLAKPYKEKANIFLSKDYVVYSIFLAVNSKENPI